MIRLFLTISGLGIAVILAGQSPLYSNFEHYDTEDGLPQIYITAIEQDNFGFIWVATQDGIARFDGKEFIKFGITSGPPYTISTPRVVDIRLGRDDMLYLLHFNKKVDMIDPATFLVTQDISPIATADYDDFKLSVGKKSSVLNYFSRSRNRNHLVVRKDLEYHMYDSLDSQLLKLFSQEHHSESVVYGYDVDDEGRLWLVTDKGLEVSDINWSTFRRIDIPTTFDFDPSGSNSVPIVSQSQQRIFFATIDRFFIYNEKKHTFQELKLPPIENTKLHVYFPTTIDHQGRVWFVYQGFVFRLEEDNSVTAIWEYPGRSTLYIDEIYLDKTQMLWVGINTGGLYRINPLTPTFNSVRYRKNFLVDILIDHVGLPESEIPSNWNVKGWSYDLRYLLTKEGELLLTEDGYDHGRHRRIFHLKNKQLNSLQLEDDQWSYVRGIGMSSDRLYALDSQGNFFIWKDWKNTYPDDSKSLEITDFTFVDMVVDENFQWILESNNRLIQVDNGEIIQTHYPGSLDFPMITLHQDLSQKDILWIGTYGGGLIQWSKKTSLAENVFLEEHGLTDNVIAGIVPDKKGNLWLSTFNGISRFNPGKRTFTNYNKQDGLIESEFNRHHEFQLPDGRIALGGTEGFSVFDPAEFENDLYNPEVMISAVSIDDIPLSYIDSSSILSEPLNKVREIKLDYDQNSLAFEIAAMQFNNPSKNQYRYQLVGFNDRWVETGTNRSIRFDNLPPGRYTLLLNASNTNQIWSEKVRELSIRVYPPPWLSWWAYMLYIVIASFLVYVYWRSYKIKLIRNQEEEFNRREAARLKELDSIKTRFFSNITHEFRTPLTLILSPLEKHLKEYDVTGKTREILKSNLRHGKKLLDLVNQLLDISKLESGHMQSHQSMAELGYFLGTRLDEFREVAIDKDIRLTFTNKNLQGHYLFDRTHWEKILQNVLSNALKFTPEGGKVWLEAEEVVHEGRTMVKLVVRDTGIGIAADQLPKLFDRFYQADDTETRVQGGTGIGLSLVKELTDLLEGSIEVISEVGKGSTFRVMLPVDKIEQASVEKSPDAQEGDEQVIQPEESSLILVVEDNEELRSFIVESLNEKYKVLDTDNGHSAWEIIEDRLPDIVVSDVMMPGINGVNLCEMTKKDIRTAHIGFIMLTAKSAQESKIAGLEAGADEYLTKPFHFYELELRIYNLIRQQINQRNHLKEELFSINPQMEIPDVKDAFVKKLYNYLKTHLKDPDLGVESVAEAMAMSRRTLNRKLKAILNISPHDLIRHYQLRGALTLIQAGETISKTAYEVGFESPSYFSTVFREAYGKSPSEYQKSMEVKK